jgi:hypothetical protein
LCHGFVAVIITRVASKQYFGELPIRVIDFSDRTEIARHDRIVTLVEQIQNRRGNHCMKILKDYQGRDVRLTEERLQHILEHQEMASLAAALEETLHPALSRDSVPY